MPPLRFHELFYPEEVAVGPFEPGDWSAFLGLMQELLRLHPGAPKTLKGEMEKWSGGIQILAAALADKVVRSPHANYGGVHGARVERIAKEMAARGANDAIRRFYNGLREDLRNVLTRLGAEGHTRMPKGIGNYANRFGLARPIARTSETDDTMWESACEF